MPQYQVWHAASQKSTQLAQVFRPGGPAYTELMRDLCAKEDGTVFRELSSVGRFAGSLHSLSIGALPCIYLLADPTSQVYERDRCRVRREMSHVRVCFERFLCSVQQPRYAPSAHCVASCSHRLSCVWKVKA